MENIIQNQGIASFGLGTGTLIGLGIAFFIVMVAIIILKGYSLWHAAKRGEKWWFIVLLVINTVGILELVYLTWVAKVWHKKS